MMNYSGSICSSSIIEFSYNPMVSGSAKLRALFVIEQKRKLIRLVI